MCVAVAVACSVGQVSAAQITTATPQALASTLRFPEGLPLPAGLVEQGSGSRHTVSEIAGTFRNSRDAAQLLANWGWEGNVYRSYTAAPGAGPETPARIEISLHQFHSSVGAAYALPYLAHDRAVTMHHREQPIGLLLPCEATLLDDGSATQFLRSRNLLVRVTVVMPEPGGAGADVAAYSTATSLALAVLAQAGGDSPAMNTSC